MTPTTTSISISAPRAILMNSICKSTIDDVAGLLRQAFPGWQVAVNDENATVQICISEIDIQNKSDSPFARNRNFHYLAYPRHDYEWTSKSTNNGVRLDLNTWSFEGIAFGLYGLLQEKLGIKFIHPKQTVFPKHAAWPLPAQFHWRAEPLFDKKGFHLHTLHPLELTEQLHNPDYPGALEDIKQFIDWLVRNQQNVFQFYLLRDVDRGTWPGHARQFVDYAQSRGIWVGVKFSLAVLQQKAFQTIKVLRPRYKKQIDRTLAWLFQVGWNFVTVDFTMGEYLPKFEKLAPMIRDYMVEQITEKYDTKLMFTTHVTRPKQERVNGTISDLTADEAIAKERQTGILIHTVMCYSIDEPKAPVYGNANQRFMLERAKLENQRQETWYWPESAYWIGFDNSVPMLLLPYLSARWSDIKTMQDIGVDNHLTFTSGWEWGYWLIDWSIARWSWRFYEDESPQPNEPLSALKDIFPQPSLTALWERALDLQNEFLKNRELLKFMVGLDPSAELPWPFDSPFQPRPDFTYSWLLRRAGEKETAGILQGPVVELEKFAEKTEEIVKEMKSELQLPRDKAELSSLLSQLQDELIRSLRVTGLRARHRALTIRALIADRKAFRQNHSTNGHPAPLLLQAREVRKTAETLVRKQEQCYRFPHDLIAQRRPDFTSYHFGYLYPVSELLFWRREEQQVQARRFDAFYQRIWKFRRVIGLESMFF